ncbi:MAG: phosphate ABC transporter ATP-binding protein PstB [Planctomycetota bacterium]
MTDTATNHDTALRARDFDAWYNDFQALEGVTLDMHVREVTALIGPSGCGKSTFLRWLNRMNDHVPGARASGTLELFGQDVLDKRLDAVELRRRVGMVFQKPNPFPKSVYQNVAFGVKLHAKTQRAELDAHVQRCLEEVALWDEVKDRLKDNALGLSGGQQQRLCIARALAVGPEVLLMDEPTSALDPKATLRIENLIERLRETYTIVIVTHNMQQAQRIADRTAFFYEGVLVESGETARVFGSPAQERTRDYVAGRFG